MIRNVFNVRRDMRALLILAAFYVSFGVILTLFQERVVYQPSIHSFALCPELETYERGEYQGTRFYRSQNSGPIAVLYHGNGGSACDRAPLAQSIVSAGYQVLIPEYAGYSGDERRTTHELVKQDVRNIIAYLDDSPVQVVVGESVGTGVAAYHVSREVPDELILISPFSSLADVAARRFWFYPTRLLVDNAFDSEKLLDGYTGSVTIIHGTSDRIVALESGRSLYDSLGTAMKSFIAIEGAGHNDLFAYEAAWAALHNALVD